MVILFQFHCLKILDIRDKFLKEKWRKHNHFWLISAHKLYQRRKTFPRWVAIKRPTFKVTWYGQWDGRKGEEALRMRLSQLQFKKSSHWAKRLFHLRLFPKKLVIYFQPYELSSNLVGAGKAISLTLKKKNCGSFLQACALFFHINLLLKVKKKSK